MIDNRVASFVNRLKKIGIEVKLLGNYPWVYLDSVNGKKVRDKYAGNHGFTVFFMAIRAGQLTTITDTTVIFNQIRKMLKK